VERSCNHAGVAQYALTVEQVFHHIPLGAHLAYSDGTEKPPREYVQKRNRWERHHGCGRMSRKDFAATADSTESGPTFRLLKYADGNIFCWFRLFPLTTSVRFALLELPRPGSFLVTRDTLTGTDLLHIADCEASALSRLAITPDARIERIPPLL